MNYLVIVRHGRYGHDGFLTSRGEQEILEVVKKVKGKIGSFGRTKIFSSCEVRAIQSAIVALRHWSDDKSVEITGDMIVDNVAPWAKKVEAFNELRNQADYPIDTVFWFAHLEEINRFAPCFMKELPGVNDLDISYGTTLIINIEQKTQEVVNVY